MVIYYINKKLIQALLSETSLFITTDECPVGSKDGLGALVLVAFLGENTCCSGMNWLHPPDQGSLGFWMWVCHYQLQGCSQYLYLWTHRVSDLPIWNPMYHCLRPGVPKGKPKAKKWTRLQTIFLGSKTTVDGNCSREIKDTCFLEANLWKT